MNYNNKILPFFPLSVFLLPREDIPLQIFEPRYKQLIGDAREHGITFVIPFVIESRIQEYGCEVRLKEVVAESPAGRMVITIKSVAVVKINNFTKKLDDKLYAGGEISYMESPQNVASSELINLIVKYADHYESEFLTCCDDSPITHYDVLKALNLSSEEKFDFVCIACPKQKEQFLIDQMHFLMMIRNQEELLGNNFGLN